MLYPVAIALAFSVALAICWRLMRTPRFLVLALAWAAYAGYEYLMYTRVLCTGECNIRVDLLLIYPALAGSTLWYAVAAALKAVKQRRGAKGEA